MPPPEPGDLGPFSLASKDRILPLLERAGFSETRTEEIPVRFACRDVDDYLRYVGETAGPAAVGLQGLSDAARAAIRAKLEAAFSPFAAGGGYALPGVALVAAAS